MTLPENMGDREYEKFVEDAAGNVAVRQGPGGINDEDGNVLAIDTAGRAQVYDMKVQAELGTVNDSLIKIIELLECIAGG
jgi:hypothetical protein